MRRVLLLFFVLFPHGLSAQTSLDTFVIDYANRHSFSGTVLVQAGGAIRFERSFGMASRQLEVPNANDTRYWIASVTKTFTSILILRLQEQGASRWMGPSRPTSRTTPARRRTGSRFTSC